MKTLTKIFVGVDVSKDSLAIHILPLEESLVVQNNAKGLRDLLAKLKAHTIGQVVCEASGGYETNMLKEFRKHGHKTWCVEPKRIKHFIRGQGIRCKTDKIDAQMIALFASKMENQHEQVFERNELLHSLVARKKDLSGMIAQEKARLKHPQENFKKEIKKHISFMQQEIKLIDNKISKFMEKNAPLSKKTEILASVPGVGKQSAAVLIAELPELGSIDHKKIAALVGVAPYPRESGIYKGKSITSGGRVVPRTALFMVTLTAIRHNAKFRVVYENLLETGKAKMVAIVAIMRRMLIVLNAMIRDESYWNESTT